MIYFFFTTLGFGISAFAVESISGDDLKIPLSMILVSLLGILVNLLKMGVY